MMNVTLKLSCALLLLGFSACAAQAPWPTKGVFAGYYYHGFEKSDFKPNGTTDVWWLSGNISSVVNLFIAPSRNELPQVKEPVYLVVRGSLTPGGGYGHLNAYKRELSVTEVLEVRKPISR
jgi:hypothetical protein